MAVYVDNMRAKYRGMIMCHMIADTPEELIKMAQTIGVNPKWIQEAGTWREHFDISLEKRRAAILAGAIEISMLELGRRLNQRRASSMPPGGGPG